MFLRYSDLSLNFPFSKKWIFKNQNELHHIQHTFNMNNAQADAEDAARRAAENAAFLASITVGSKTTPPAPKCPCGEDATVIDSTKGTCCSDCANRK
jgi:hypothetical protein